LIDIARNNGFLLYMMLAARIMCIFVCLFMTVNFRGIGAFHLGIVFCIISFIFLIVITILLGFAILSVVN
jgi:hypothetical protein